jgi:hypothetical protein
VIALIKVMKLGRDYGGQLDPYVRDKFDELWQSAAQDQSEFE